MPLLPRNCRSYESRTNSHCPRPERRMEGRRVGKVEIDTRDRVNWKIASRKTQREQIRRSSQETCPSVSTFPLSREKEDLMKGVFFSVAIFILFQLIPGAHSPEASLPPVVVTATRTEVPLNQLTTSLTVITSEELRERQAELVSEVLRDVAGINVIQTGSMGTATSVFIRGSDIKSGVGFGRRR